MFKFLFGKRNLVDLSGFYLNGIYHFGFPHLLGMTLRQALSITIASKQIVGMIALYVVLDINLYIHVMLIVNTSILIY